MPGKSGRGMLVEREREIDRGRGVKKKGERARAWRQT